MRVFFDIKHLYYVPQYLPVKEELENRGVECTFVLYTQQLLNNVLKEYVEKHQLKNIWVQDKSMAQLVYKEQKPDWIIYGNACEDLSEVHVHSKTALMQHGIGPKSCYYDVSNSPIMHRFVEGQHRLKRLQKLFPNKSFIDTGYAKLDPILNGTCDDIDLNKINLDPNKQTILYAPTFYPSSIECLPKNFPALFDKYNIIIKPHFFSLIKKSYQSQQKLLVHWAKYENTYVSNVNEVSILPYMKIASLMISDASSTLFEFTALNKPAIWCDFYKLRWSYRGIFSFRFKRRLDDDLKYFGKVAARTTNIKELVEQTSLHIATPNIKEMERKEMTEFLTGKVDGKSSERIANFIINGDH
jgi:hypothetical protein